MTTTPTTVAAPTPYRVIECSGREEWLAARAARLGDGTWPISASEAAAAMGLDPWTSPPELYAVKKGIMPRKAENVKMVWGRRLQRAIANGFAEDTGREVIDLGEYTILEHRELPWLRCTLDYIEVDPKKGEGCLEIKNTTLGGGWEDEPPLHYQIQNQIQMFVRGTSYGTPAALVSGWELRWADIDRNDVFLKRAISKLEEFQWRLKTSTPPAAGAEAVESAREAYKALYPRDTGETIALNADACAILDQLLKAEATEKVSKEQAELLKLQIKQRLRTATHGVLPDGRRVSWKTQVRHDPPREAKETEIRVFRVHKAT